MGLVNVAADIHLYYLARAISGRGSLSGGPLEVDRIGFCLEGYPRSANSTAIHYLAPIVASELKGDAEIIHHTHDVRAVKLSVLLGVPCVVLIRDPLPAVVSNYIYHQGRRSPRKLIKRWLKFYRAVQGMRDDIILCEFSTAINDINKLILSINSKYGLLLPQVDDPETQLKNLAVAQMQHSVERRGGEYHTVYALPDCRRNEMKSEVSSLVESDPLFPQALDLFRNINIDV